MLPELFLNRMEELLGSDYQAFLQSYDRDNYQALRLNTLKKNNAGDSPSPKLLSDNDPMFSSLEPVPWGIEGYYYDKECQPGKHPYHEAGVYYIQEPSAMAPVSLLGVKPGDYVLDLCAAPGGKSTQIGSAMKGEGLLVCNEIHPARAKILSENIERMGIENACVTNETPKHLAEIFPQYFDKILVDAPCSGEGMFRKKDIACEQWSEENVVLCAERQQEILDCAAAMLRPGGSLVYSTCTFAVLENEGSIGHFLDRHKEFSLVQIDKDSLYPLKDLPKGALDGREGLSQTLRLWPHLIHGEGHFAALLVKDGEILQGTKKICNNGMQIGIPEKDRKEFQEFSLEYLTEEWRESHQEGVYIRFGDSLYFAPKGMPSIKGMKVLRPGLQLGSMKKNRFEPAHALAHALSPAQATNVFSITVGDRISCAYINGETFLAEGEKGWYLICVDGFSLGWGKLAGGMMKNHYPKGLRKNIKPRQNGV